MYIAFSIHQPKLNFLPPPSIQPPLVLQIDSDISENTTAVTAAFITEVGPQYFHMFTFTVCVPSCGPRVIIS